MIPERVEVVTAITSKKTMQYVNALGQFHYHHIKLSCFGGFIEKRDEFNMPFLIATPEKALLDFLYFKTQGMKKITVDVFETSFRLQNLEIVDVKKLKHLAATFHQKKLSECVTHLIKIRGKNA